MRNRLGWLILLLLVVLPLMAGEEKSTVDQSTPEKSTPEKRWPLAEIGPRPHSVPTPPAADIDAAIERGLEFLLKTQNKNGSWGSADIYRPGDIYAPVPGSHQAFRAAVTSMCISALIEVGGDRPEIVKSLDRAEAWVFQNLPHVRRATPDVFYNVWTHAYAIPALVQMLGRKTDDAQRATKIHELIKQQIDLLDRYETVDGGWGYYDFKAQTKKPSDSSNSFVTAAVLVALEDAKKVGEDVAAALDRPRQGLDHPPAQARLFLRLRRVPEIRAADGHQSAGRQPGARRPAISPCGSGAIRKSPTRL